MPVSHGPETLLQVRWEFGEVKRQDMKDHSYLAGT